MSDLADFLLARLAEDEAVANEAGAGSWHWEHGWGDMCNDADCPYGQLFDAKADGKVYLLMDVHGLDVHEEWQGAPHIARWDPARVLADIESKRAIVQEAVKYIPGQPGYGMAQQPMKHLATIYAGHPGWCKEWRP